MDGAGSAATDVPDAAEIIARARAMISPLAARSLAARRSRRIPDETISNQYEYVGSSWGGVMFGLENKDLML
jgi:hypothetical protein